MAAKKKTAKSKGGGRRSSASAIAKAKLAAQTHKKLGAQLADVTKALKALGDDPHYDDPHAQN